MNLTQHIVIRTPAGELLISQTVWTTLFITIFLTAVSLMLTRKLSAQPGKAQVAVEGAVGAMAYAVRAVTPERWAMLFPFVATLWLFIITANLSGIVPGMQSPTADVSTTSALALIVFFSVHWFGIRSEGVKSYLHHYLSPTPFMLPFQIISEISRTIALAIRLFGNMMSLEMAAMMILLVAGFLVPVPLLMLHIVEALVQAYIFGMLALIYIASGIDSQRHRQEGVNSNGTQ
jgi:F-type H+-transporting ATPase subunit a